MPKDVTAPSSPSLLLPANFLIFAANLNEATELVGVSLESGGRPRLPTRKRNEARNHTRRAALRAHTDPCIVPFKRG